MQRRPAWGRRAGEPPIECRSAKIRARLTLGGANVAAARCLPRCSHFEWRVSRVRTPGAGPAGRAPGPDHRGLLPHPDGRQSVDLARRKMGQLHGLQPHRGRQRDARGNLARVHRRRGQAVASAPLRPRHQRRAMDRSRARSSTRPIAVSGPSTRPGPIEPPVSWRRPRPAGGRGGRGGRRRGDGQQAAGIASPDGKWIATPLDMLQPRREARADDRLRAPARGSIQGRDLRLEGLPARRPAVSRPQSARPARGADRAFAPAARHGDQKTLATHDLRPTGLAWRPDGTRLVFLADPDWRDELKYESPDIWTVTARRRSYAAHRRRVRLQRRGLLARRQVPVVRARPGHRSDHPAEAGITADRATCTSDRRRRRADQPDGDLGPRARPDALVARQPVHLLHGRDRRREPPVPRVGARRPRRAGDHGTAPNRRPDVRQGVHEDRLHRRRARGAARRLRREHRRHRRAPPDRCAQGDRRRDRASAGPSGCSGAARTARRSRAG